METNVADPQATGGILAILFVLVTFLEMVSLRDPFFLMVGC